jgi:hypothetical protein
MRQIILATTLVLGLSGQAVANANTVFLDCNSIKLQVAKSGEWIRVLGHREKLQRNGMGSNDIEWYYYRDVSSDLKQGLLLYIEPLRLDIRPVKKNSNTLLRDEIKTEFCSPFEHPFNTNFRD